MIRIYLVALLAFAFLVGDPLSARECVERAAVPSNVRNIRARRTAECSYDFNQLVTRITEFAVGKEPYTVETVEKILGVPELTTDFDDPTAAIYSMDLSGKGGWRSILTVREAFPGSEQPPRFVPGLHPKRLYKIDAAELIVEFDFHNSQMRAIASVKRSPAQVWLELQNYPSVLSRRCYTCSLCSRRKAVS